MTSETPLASMQAACCFEQEIHAAEKHRSFSYSNLLVLELESQKGVEINQIGQMGYSVSENILSIFSKNIYDAFFSVVSN